LGNAPVWTEPGHLKEVADNAVILDPFDGLLLPERVCEEKGPCMKRSAKPVRECYGCSLNLGEACGIYGEPREMWHRRRCPGYMNELLTRRYEEAIARQPPDGRKEKRRQAARSRATEDHHQGTLPVALLGRR
jgi:hypothetical protein